MIFFSKLKKYLLTAVAALPLAATLVSCDSWIYNDEEDCVYYVRFEYDYNLKWANAFPSEVKSVTLYILDEKDNVVLTRSENTSVLAQQDYRMVIDDPKIKPGRYRLLAWAGDEEVGSFPKTEGALRTDHDRRLKRDVREDGTHHHNGQMDRLYHGSLPSTLNTPLATDATNVKDGYCVFSEGYQDVFTIPMMKDTNHIRIVLQQQSGDITGDDFDYFIDDNNGHMDADNNLCDATTLRYHPWGVYSGGADWMLENPDDFVYSFNTAVADFTTSRLMEDHSKSALLTITRKDAQPGDKPVVRLPLIQALLLAKSAYYSYGPGSRDDGTGTGGQYRYLTDQEWLDRQDEYSLIFLLDQGGRWVSTQINILSWKVVIQNADL